MSFSQRAIITINLNSLATIPLKAGSVNVEMSEAGGQFPEAMEGTTCLNAGVLLKTNAVCRSPLLTGELWVNDILGLGNGGQIDYSCKVGVSYPDLRGF
jgi:hypothetical protein